MSYLPILSFNSTPRQLPPHSELIDHKAPFDYKKHKFKAVSDLAETMHNYALACAEQVEAIIQTRIDQGDQDSAFSQSYKRFDPQSTEAHFWKVERTDPDSDNLRYSIAASKANGAWERFSFNKSPYSDEIKNAEWKINGYLAGIFKLRQSRNNLWKVSVDGPNLKRIGRMRTDFIKHKNGLLRIHNTLTRQAQCLLDWNKKFGMNGQGVKIGDYKLLVRKLNGSEKGKAFILTQDKDFREDEHANAFIVKTSSEGSIDEIIQYSRRSDFSFWLRPSKSDIFESAELHVNNRKKEQELKNEVEAFAGLLDLFREETTEGKNILAKIKEIEEQFYASEERYHITVPTEGQLEQESKATLLEPTNISRMGDKLSLIGRSTKECKNIPETLKDFYNYTGLRPGQISFAFYKGGVNSTKVINAKNEEVYLRSFGDADLRREFQKNGDSVFILNDTNLEAFFRNLEMDLTTQEQNNAIYRWSLLNSPELFHKLGILVERSPDPKQAETLHLICPSGRDLLRKLKISIPKGIADLEKVTTMTFPNTTLLKTIQDRVCPQTDAKNGKPRRVQVDSMEMFYEMLRDIGFKIASPLETEDYIRRKLNSDEVNKTQEFLQSRIDFKSAVYTNELGLSLLEKHLTEEGYTNIERVNKGQGGNATILFKCSKEGVDYLARVLTHKSNVSAKRAMLKSCAEEEKRKPLLFLFNDINNLERTRGSIEDLTPTIK